MDNYRLVDTVLACMLILVSLSGIVFNSAALSYFLTVKTSKPNNRYIRNVYSIISTVDLLACVTIFPIIEAALQHYRASTLFSSPWFCDIWGVTWSAIPIMSIFLIAFLSVSRLCVIIRPSMCLNERVAWAIPLLFSLSLLALILGMFWSHGMYIVYRPEWLSCYPALFPAHEDPDTLVTPRDVQRGVVLSSLFSVIPGLSIIPISGSAVVSVIYLRISARASGRISVSAREQNSATVTILLVTLLYLLFNAPFSLTVIGGLVINHSMSRDSLDQVTVHSYNTVAVWESRAMNEYAYFVVFYLCICLNSLFNPIMYMYRMKKFKSWIKAKAGMNSDSTSREPLSPRGAKKGVVMANKSLSTGDANLVDITASINQGSSAQL